MTREELRDAIANIAYDHLEGSIANQDYGRQVRQWEQCKRIAEAQLLALEAAGVRLVPSQAKKEILAVSSINKWLSAALEDPLVCDEMKADILVWFDICYGKNNN